MRLHQVTILSILLTEIFIKLIQETSAFVVNNCDSRLHTTKHWRILTTTTSHSPIFSFITGGSEDILSTSKSNVKDEDSQTNLIGTKSLGVDYGTIRTGVAVTVGYAPIPLTILDSHNSTELAMDVVKLSQSEKATQIVIGLPLHKNGTISDQANIVKTFAEIVACAVHKKLGPNSTVVYLFDERYSSKEAMARILSKAPSKDHNKQFLIDADSACIILEHFYAENGVGKQLVTVPDHLRQECDDIWLGQDRINKEKQQKIIDDRMNALNARREMIKRVQMETSTTSTSRKKKKNKKKKRKTAKWTVL